MRVLIVGQFLGTGGAEQSLIPLAKELHSAGYELSLILLKPPVIDFVFSNFPGTVLAPKDASPWQQFQTLLQLNRAIANADVVVATSELSPTYITWLLSLWHHKPLVADVQVCLSRWISGSSKSIHHYLSRWVYPHISYIRCVSKGVAQDLQLNYGVPIKNLSVIYVSFELDKIARAAQSPIPAINNHIFSRPTIVAAGRLTSQKRFDIAIESFLCLRQDYKIDAHLLILGDGELRPQLEQQVQDLGLTNQVFLPGFVENPYAYFNCSKVFLLSSDYEGFGRVLLEALAVGCPAVSTDCPFGPHEILEGGKSGLLTPMANPKAIAHALAQLLTNSELAQKLREAGLQRAKAFDTQTTARQYQTLLNQALEH